ncbi:MAG: hypothetical protein Q7K57_15025 [Burkholderiaceae bacterium]|nr:hypothetical protein [Burkholderiaceae bacterium]
MKNLNVNDIVERSMKIREKYHLLENKYHGNQWTVEEDALAFLTDAGLVGRLTMSQQGRWPTDADGIAQLKHKLGECMWWITVLSKRMDIDMNDALGTFLVETEKKLSIG